MAIDVATPCTNSGTGFFLGVTTGRCDDLGNKARILESGATTAGNTPEQFTKTGITDTTLANKLTARFDDPRYYTGDAAT